MTKKYLSKEEIADLDAQPLNEEEFWVKQSEILKVIDKPIPQPKEPSTLSRLTLRQLREATMNDELVIDKYLSLVYPLGDSRAEPERELLYQRQESLMMQPDDTEEQVLSSPSGNNEHCQADWTTISVGALKNLTDDEVKTFKLQNDAFLKKIYPDEPDHYP